jgi:hypothetical protein
LHANFSRIGYDVKIGYEKAIRIDNYCGSKTRVGAISIRRTAIAATEDQSPRVNIGDGRGAYRNRVSVARGLQARLRLAE